MARIIRLPNKHSMKQALRIDELKTRGRKAAQASDVKRVLCACLVDTWGTFLSSGGLLERYPIPPSRLFNQR